MQKHKQRFPFGVMPYFAFLYMTNATYQNYYSNFLVGQGIERSAIGNIMAAATLVSMLAQPLWGAAGDRMRMKNTLLSILTGASAVVLFIGGFANSLLFALAVVCGYAFFQTSITPLLDTIALESLEKGGHSFGPVRMTGTIAYAVAAPVIGFVMADNYRLAPFFAALFLGLGLIASFFLPKVEGHQHGQQKKVSMLQLLKNKPLMIMIAFAVVQMLGMSYYNTYFSIYVQELGGNSSLIGLAFFIAAAGEIPFLLVGDKIFRKMGVGRLLMLSAGVIALRMLLIGVTTNMTIILVAQLLHGWGYIVMTFAMAKYVNLTVPGELKASGQMLFSVMGLGIARMIGAWGSGHMVTAMGLRMPFFVAAGVCVIGLIVFGTIIMRDPQLKFAGREAQ